MAVVPVVSLLIVLSAFNLVALIGIKRNFKKLRRSVPKNSEIVVPLRCLVFHNSEVVKSHVAALEAESGSNVAAPPISYPMAKAMRALEPETVTSGASGVVMCSVALGDKFRNRIQPCLDSHRRFAERHGMTYVLLQKAPVLLERPAPWMKVPLLMRQIEQKFKYVFWIDADAMITDYGRNISTQLELLESESKSFLITEDEGGINSGVMFIRNNARVRHILDLVWLYDADILNGVWEQNALQYLMNVFPAVAREVVIDPKPKNFNSFPRERNLFQPTAEKNTWSAGDFICHFSGIRSPHLERCIGDYRSALQAA